MCTQLINGELMPFTYAHLIDSRQKCLPRAAQRVSGNDMHIGSESGDVTSGGGVAINSLTTQTDFRLVIGIERFSGGRVQR